MKVRYNIVDNFLDKDSFIKLKDLMCSQVFPWYFAPNGVSKTGKKDGVYHTHTFYDFDSFNSPEAKPFILPLLNKVAPKSLIRMKANLYPKTYSILEHGPHTDFDFKHKGFIFYINTNNGFTKLNDGTKIESIENRGLFFDSSKKHNSSTCTDSDFRMNININYF